MLLITKQRKECGISQSEVARRAGMHVSSVSNIETGKLSPWPGQRKKLKRVMRDAGWKGEGDLFAEVEE